MLTTLRMRRQMRGMSLQEFAVKHGLNKTRLCRVERGREVIPDAWRPILAAALDVPENELIGERGLAKLAE